MHVQYCRNGERADYYTTIHTNNKEFLHAQVFPELVAGIEATSEFFFFLSTADITNWNIARLQWLGSNVSEVNCTRLKQKLLAAFQDSHPSFSGARKANIAFFRATQFICDHLGFLIRIAPQGLVDHPQRI